jgi:predicted nucleic acid-binding protein
VVTATADWADVHRIAERLSAKHTKTDGPRAMDILHVATALHLGAREFLSFDGNQRKLARAEGMKAKP